jgi:hypothetical protein
MTGLTLTSTSNRQSFLLLRTDDGLGFVRTPFGHGRAMLIDFLSVWRPLIKIDFGLPLLLRKNQNRSIGPSMGLKAIDDI